MNAAEVPTFHPLTEAFLDSILRLEPRVAAFDCDGTLWSGDLGERFFDWELRQGDVVSAEKLIEEADRGAEQALL